MEILLSKTVSVRAPAATPNVLAVAAMFGLGLGAEETVALIEPTRLTLQAGQVVLITGPSGAGKSTVLRCLRERFLVDGSAAADSPGVFDLDQPIPSDLAERALVDCFPDLSLPEALAALARAGLSDAFVLLRRPGELSEGQRFRFQLARFFAGGCGVLLADEFAATLDRVTAKILAYQLGKFIRRSGRLALLATTHDDLAADLGPELHVQVQLGGHVQVIARSEAFSPPGNGTTDEHRRTRI